MAKMWDLLISKGMLALTFWNVMVCSTGLTFLEYKNNTELNIQKQIQEERIKEGKPPMENDQKPLKKLMKFYYGFATKFEAYWRVMKTNDYLVGILFSDYGEDPRINFNGTEWTTLFYYTMLERVAPEKYKADPIEFDHKNV
jgi:hypothetical protein